MFQSAARSLAYYVSRAAGWMIPRHVSQFYGLVICASPGVLVAIFEGQWLLGGLYWSGWHLMMASANAADDLFGDKRCRGE